MKLFWGLVLVLLMQPASAQDEVDYVSLASILVRDGFYGRAQRTLEKIKPDDDVDNEKVEFLWGAVELYKKNYGKARERFLSSINLGLKDTEIYLYLADLELKTKNIEKAKKYIEKVSGHWQKKLPYFLVKAEILWKSGDYITAWKILDQAQNLERARVTVAKKKFSYLMERQLYFSAYKLAVEFMEKSHVALDVVAMASQLRKAGQDGFSLKLLQMASLQHPGHEMVTLELAQVYISLGQGYSAALILEEGARRNPSFAFEASEILRQAGKSYRAQYMNLLTTDPQKKLRQKVALYLEEDDYHSLNYLLPQLQKYSLLESDEIRYAVAYSLFQVGEFDRAGEMLKGLQDPALFEKSVELRREMDKCKEESWSCSEAI